MLERIVSALKLDPQLFNSATNVSIANAIEDFSNVFGRLVTRKSVKVSQLQLFLVSRIFALFVDSCIQPTCSSGCQ